MFTQDYDLNDVFTQDSDLNGVFTQYSDLNDVFTQDSDLNGVFTQDSDLNGVFTQDSDLNGVFTQDSDFVVTHDYLFQDNYLSCEIYFATTTMYSFSKFRTVLLLEFICHIIICLFSAFRNGGHVGWCTRCLYTCY